MVDLGQVGIDLAAIDADDVPALVSKTPAVARPMPPATPVIKYDSFHGWTSFSTGKQVANGVLMHALPGGGAAVGVVGGEQHVVHREQRAVGGQGFDLEDIERGPGDQLCSAGRARGRVRR